MTAKRKQVTEPDPRTYWSEWAERTGRLVEINKVNRTLTLETKFACDKSDCHCVTYHISETVTVDQYQRLLSYCGKVIVIELFDGDAFMWWECRD